MEPKQENKEMAQFILERMEAYHHSVVKLAMLDIFFDESMIVVKYSLVFPAERFSTIEGQMIPTTVCLN